MRSLGMKQEHLPLSMAARGSVRLLHDRPVLAEAKTLAPDRDCSQATRPFPQSKNRGCREFLKGGLTTMRLRSWNRPRAGRRRLGLIVGCAVVGGWFAGIVFWALVLPVMLDLGEAGVQRLLGATSGRELEEITGSGTGFVVSPAGHVLTNYHIIRDDCASITARIAGEDHALAVLASDPANDLAILKLPVDMAQAASFRDRDVRLGEAVIVAGFPMRDVLSSTIHVTAGLVSKPCCDI